MSELIPLETFLAFAAETDHEGGALTILLEAFKHGFSQFKPPAPCYRLDVEARGEKLTLYIRKDELPEKWDRVLTEG